MTARAFLRLSDDLREAFASAQDDESVRYLRVEVVNGDTLTTVGSSAKGADIKTDFDSLAQVRIPPMRHCCIRCFLFPALWHGSHGVHSSHGVVHLHYARSNSNIVCGVPTTRGSPSALK
ncbi:unnamed protein product, partial [Ectocarpus sp. 12 AP-2014]